MIWSVTVTKFGTARTVFVVGVGGAGVGAWACPVNPRAHSRAVVRKHSLIEHLIARSPLVNELGSVKEILIDVGLVPRHNAVDVEHCECERNDGRRTSPRFVCPVHSSTSMPVDR